MELVDSALGESKEPKALTIIEIMELPVAERMDLLDHQMREAAHYYTSDPDLIFEANDDMMEY